MRDCETYYAKVLTDLLQRFRAAKPNDVSTVTPEQYQILENIQTSPRKR